MFVNSTRRSFNFIFKAFFDRYYDLFFERVPLICAPGSLSNSWRVFPNYQQNMFHFTRTVRFVFLCVGLNDMCRMTKRL